MKLLLLLAVTLAIGLLLGWYIGYTRPLANYARFQNREWTIDFQLIDAARNTGNWSEGLRAWERNAMGMHVYLLDKLEAGDTEFTKRVLSRQIAGYYRTFRDRETEWPEQGEILRKIETLRVRSRELNEELHKPVP